MGFSAAAERAIDPDAKSTVNTRVWSRHHWSFFGSAKRLECSARGAQ